MLWLLPLRAQRVQGFAFAVASETSLDAKRSVASKFFDWSCDAVQQDRMEHSRVVRMAVYQLQCHQPLLARFAWPTGLHRTELA